MNMQYIAVLNTIAEMQGLVNSTAQQFEALQEKFNLLNTKVDQLQEQLNDGFDSINERIADIKADMGIHVDVIGGY